MNKLIPPGTVIHAKYEILQHIGSGSEGAVYLVKEKSTGIERALKFFKPAKNKPARSYAKKLHKLQDCSILIHYHFQDEWYHNGELTPYLVSEYVEGQLLSLAIKQMPQKKFEPYEALHILYSLVLGLEEIHQQKEYHGDIHTENILLLNRGLNPQVKLVDLCNHGKSDASLRRSDILQLIDVFYDILGGKKEYSKLPYFCKDIIKGKKESILEKKFPNISKLRQYLEDVSLDL